METAKRVSLDSLERYGTDRAILIEIARKQEEQFMALSDALAALQQAQQDAQAAAEAEHAELADVAAQVGDLHSQIADLQGQVASGGAVTEADLEDLTATATQIAQQAQAAVEAAKAAAPDAPAPAPAPAPTAPGGGTAPVDPTAGGGVTPVDPTAGGTVDPTAGGPDPGSPVDTGAPSGGTAPVAGARSEYVFDGDASTVDVNVWPASPNETTEATPRELFYYSGDSQNADGSWTTNGDGVGGAWHLYTGPTQPAGSSGGPAGVEG